MFKTRNAILLIVAVILVSGVTTAAYFKKAAPVTSSSLPASPSLKTSSSIPASVNPSVYQSTYMSTATIRSILDQAYEQHRWNARDQALLNILNARENERYDNRISMPR